MRWKPERFAPGLTQSVYVHAYAELRVAAPESSMGPFCVTQPNPSADWPNPTQPNPILTVTGWHYHFITPSDQFPVPVRSAIKSNLTARCSHILSNRALNALKQSFQNLSTFAVVDPTQRNQWVNPTHGQLWVWLHERMNVSFTLTPGVALAPRDPLGTVQVRAYCLPIW